MAAFLVGFLRRFVFNFRRLERPMLLRPSEQRLQCYHDAVTCVSCIIFSGDLCIAVLISIYTTVISHVLEGILNRKV